VAMATPWQMFKSDPFGDIRSSL